MAVTLPGRGDAASRRGAVVNLGIFAILLLVIAPLALRATQPPPPSIAEFAPEAKQIKDPPKEQTGVVGAASGQGQGQGQGPGQGGGSGGGGGGTGTASPSASARPSPTAAPQRTPNAHHCVGNPPRQTEDPQSPPCVAYWDPNTAGGNGGATTQGVTATTVTVYVWDINWGDTKVYTWVDALIKFFNDRFEFYGRHLKVIYSAPGTSCNQDTPQVAQQHANDVLTAGQAVGGLFASTEYCPADGAEVSYYITMRNNKVISTFADPTRLGEQAFFAPNDPYIYDAIPGIDTIERNLADWTCRGLANHPARYSGDPTMAGATRKLGIAYTTSNSLGPDLAPLQDGLSSCGITVPAADIVAIPVESASTYATTTAKLHTDSVSTVICMCDSGYVGEFMNSAQSSAYYPEWFVNSYFLGESEAHASLFFPPREAQSSFGMSFVNKRLALTQQPWYWACKEESPAGCNDFVQDSTQAVYSSLLLLASGIQMAGPHLTPQTFRDALRKTHFPDPGAGAAPYYQAGVGFEGGGHSFNNDAALMWYSPTTQSVETGSPGAWCYANGGRRYALGQFPASDTMLFTGTCH